MEAQQLENYLARIGQMMPVSVDPEGLAQLHEHHLLSVPFENLDIFLKHPIGLEPEQVLTKIVEKHRGGFCFETNYAFYLLLQALGFSVSLMSARVFDGESFGAPFDHLLLKVHFDSGDYLADVGFGDAFLRPLALSGGQYCQQGVGYRLIDQDGLMVLQQSRDETRWLPLYQFTLDEYDIHEFEHMCVYHRGSPASRFTQKLLCTLACPAGRLTLSGRRLIVTTEQQRATLAIVDAKVYQQHLSQYFGIELPEVEAAQLFERAASGFAG